MEAMVTEHGLSALRTPGPRPALAGAATTLREDEFAALHSGRWFAELPPSLRQAIIGRARVQRVAAGTRITQRGDAAGNWVGVARGALRLGPRSATAACSRSTSWGRANGSATSHWWTCAPKTSTWWRTCRRPC